MDKNIDSLEETGSDEEATLKNASFNENGLKEDSEVNDINSIENNDVVKQQNKSNAINKEINNLNLDVSVQKDFTKSNIGDEIPKNPIKDIKNVKVQDQSESIKIEKIKPIKEIPIEKKPFNEFINDHLLPSLSKEFKERGFIVEDINLKNTSRPIAGDKCWVVYCEIKDICNFWLSFEKDDISSLKSISLSKSNQRPSVIESFLIDEKRITLKLIISRILQRLNGQKLIGIN